MGVAHVFKYDATAKQLQRRFEVAGAKPLGTYSVDYMPYLPTGGLGESFSQMQHFLHHSNFPQSSFSIVPVHRNYGSLDKNAGESVGKMSATSDRGFDLIMEKLSAAVKPYHEGKFEVSGQKYRVKDFVIGIGTASKGTTSKGTIVEVEYEPSDFAYKVKSFLRDFIATFFLDHEETIKTPKLYDKKEPTTEEVYTIYTPLDTMCQYLEIFQLMNTPQISGKS